MNRTYIFFVAALLFCFNTITNYALGGDTNSNLPDLIVPQVSSNQGHSIIRKEYPTLESVIKLQDSLANSRGAELPTRSNRDISLYAVGSIPIQESVSPSGARIYNIPITTAQGYNLTPNISLIYNSQGEFNTTYTYDTYGRLSSVQSTNGTGKRYTYDAYDRITSIKDTVPDGKWLQKVYTYSTGSVLSSIAYTSQSGYITTETYFYANGHNTGISLPNNVTVWSLTSENDLGQPTAITTGSITRQYGYTPYGLPTYRKMNNGALQDFSYQFDPLTGNLLSRGNGIILPPTKTSNLPHRWKQSQTNMV